jgi:hypothetical protein
MGTILACLNLVGKEAERKEELKKWRVAVFREEEGGGTSLGCDRVLVISEFMLVSSDSM